MKIIFFFMLALCMGLSFGYDANYYSDVDRGLFSLSKSTAIGGSDFAFAADGTPQVNPANLCFDSLSQISCSYAGFYQNIFNTSVVSYSTKTGKNSGLGFSLSYLYNPDLPYNDNFQTVSMGGTDVPLYDSSLIKYHTASQIFFHAGYSQKFTVLHTVDLSLGFAMNAQRNSLPPFRGYGIGCDGGAALDLAALGLRMGLECQNITTNYLRWTPSYSEEGLPHVFFGIGWRQEIPYLYGRIQLQFKSLDVLAHDGINATENFGADSANYVQPTTKRFSKDPGYFLVNGAYGMEYTIKNVFALRLGFPVGDSYGTDWSRMAFGCGVNLMKKKLSLDFAYMTHELAGSYQVGLTYYWRNDGI